MFVIIIMSASLQFEVGGANNWKYRTTSVTLLELNLSHESFGRVVLLQKFKLSEQHRNTEITGEYKRIFLSFS